MSNDIFSKGSMPDFGELMKQAQRMQEELSRSQQKLAQKQVEASAGGGMVTVVFSGNRQLLRLQIEPTVFESNDPQLLQDLFVAAVNQGLQKIKDLEDSEMKLATSGFGLPSLG